MQTQKVVAQEVSRLVQALIAQLPLAENEQADSIQKTGTSETIPVAHAEAAPAAPVRYVTIKQLATLRPAFTEAALRDIAFKADDRKNSRGKIIEGNRSGPAGVWLKLGAKRLADLPAFDRWIESHKVVTRK